MALWTRLESLIFGGAIGAAARTAIEPQIEPARQLAWSRNTNRILGVNELARMVAQGLTDLGSAADDAKRDGYSLDKLDALAQLQLTAPAVAQALTLFRRGEIKRPALHRAYAKAQVDADYWPALDALKDNLLDPAVLAVAIQRGIIPDPGILPVGPGAGGGKVPSFPVFPVDAIVEASGSGVDRERLSVMVGNVGLPASNEQAASAYFRGIIELNDYHRAISEGNTRNEWRDAILEQARVILSPTQYANLRLRGWITTKAMHAGAAKHGMSGEDADLLELGQGRGLTWHQVWIGLQRGGVYDGPTTAIPPAFLKSLEESDIRPEWYNLAFASRYTYPSAFVMRALTQDGTLTQAQAEADLIDMGWRPDRAKQASTKWAGGGATGAKAETKAELQDEYAGGYITEADLRAALTTLGYSGATLNLEVHLSDAKRVKRWREKAVDAIGKAFIQHDIGEATALLDLAEAGVTGEAAALLLPFWKLEARVHRKHLTAAQIKKAYARAILTVDQAAAELVALDYTDADARVYLAE